MSELASIVKVVKVNATQVKKGYLCEIKENSVVFTEVLAEAKLFECPMCASHTAEYIEENLHNIQAYVSVIGELDEPEAY